VPHEGCGEWLQNLGARVGGRKQAGRHHAGPKPARWPGRAVAQVGGGLYSTRTSEPNRISCMKASPGTSKTVLIVEDDASATYIFETILTHAGYRCHTMSTGHDALRRLSEVAPDLVLVDLGLPGDIDGFELTAAVRRDYSPDLPILVVTVHVYPHDVERARKAGCTAFMSKPVAPLAVLDKVRELIGPPA
jgi:two-component system, cell cycle response regulator DivK